MPARNKSRLALTRLFARRPVNDLRRLQAALGTTSRTTVFRALTEAGYFTSYSHSGRFYTLEHIPDFNDDGIWAFKDVLFSRHRTLRATLIHLVDTAAAGQTHAELQTRVRLRVHDTLHDLVEAHQVGREELDRLFLYVSGQAETAQAQVAARLLLQTAEAPVVLLPPPTVVIEILLAFIRHPKDGPAELAARLRRLGVERVQVETVFTEHQLGKKNRPSRRLQP